MTSMSEFKTLGVIGLGYVGLPLAIAFGKKFRVIGYDMSAAKIATYRGGHDPMGEVSDAEMRAATGLEYTTDASALSAADAIIVAVPTPVGPDSYIDPARSAAPFRIFNIGNNSPVPLMDMIGMIEAAVGKKAQFNFMPMQPGDVAETSADTDDLEAAVGFKPATPLADGVRRYVQWHRQYHKV